MIRPTWQRAFRPFASASRQRIVVASSIALTLTTGCATSFKPPERAGASPAGTATLRPLPFAEILKSMSRIKPSELKEQLRHAMRSGAETEASRQEAAYVLGCLLKTSNAPDDLKEALSAFEKASGRQPLSERCQWHISECAAALGQEKVVRRALEAIKASTDSELTRAQAEYGLAQSYLRANEQKPAREAFSQVKERFPTSQYALGASYYLGEMGLATPASRAEGIELFREYLRRSPDGHFARDIVARLSALKDFQPTASDRDLFGQVHYVHGEWDEALAEWEKAKAGHRWLERALCLLRLGKQSLARAAFEEGIKQHPSDRNVAAAAQTLATMLSREEATAVWQKVRERSPQFADTAIWNLALRASPSQALTYYRQLVARYPHSDYAPESSWWLFWDAVKQGRLAAALTLAQTSFNAYPKARAAPRFSFWLGKLNERLKKRDAALQAYKQTIRLFPSSYYAHRARARLAAMAGGKDGFWAIEPDRQHPDPDWSWPDPPALMSWTSIATRYGATQEVLCRLSQWDEALKLLPEHDRSALKAWLLAKLNLPLDAIDMAAAELGGSPAKTGQWQLAYPLLYAQRIASESQRHRLDPLLVHALVREESRYNALATSRSNALGLMQLLPGTAYGVAKRIGLTLAGPEDIYHPDNNIKLGTAYLAYVLKRAGGSAMLAVAGYNGGPNAAAAWLNSFRLRGEVDLDRFVEDIPYSETRDYVRKVFASYWNYIQVYQG